MKNRGDNSLLLKDIQDRMEKKIRDNEIAVTQYWKEKLDKLLVMKPDGIASLQTEIRKLSVMMENRTTTLKKGIR